MMPVERFRGDVAVALGRELTQADMFAVAVSGGPDSMALLALAHAAWPGQVIAATVDHGLRAAAADEAAMVAAYCAMLDHGESRTPAEAGAQSVSSSRGAQPSPTTTSAPGPRPSPGNSRAGIPHTILHPTTPLGTANVQAKARAARYQLLTDWAIGHGATMLATAHHADDQAETFLMRAARGSGLAGLSGIRPRRELEADQTIPLIRPLLGWRSRDLRGIVTANGIPFVDDPSNADDHYDRTRFRRLLQQNDWLDPLHLAQSATYAREGHEALEAMIDWLWKERQAVPPAAEDQEYQTWLNLADLPREIRRRLTRQAISLTRTVNGITRPAFPAASNIEPLLDAVESGTAATHAGILVSARAEIWHFREAPPRRGT